MSDLIKRSDAIKSLDNAWINGTSLLDANEAVKQLKDLPSADRPQGEWIDRSGGIEGAWNYCSVCGEQAIDLYDFCPNCGADMRGKDDE